MQNRKVKFLHNNRYKFDIFPNKLIETAGIKNQAIAFKFKNSSGNIEEVTYKKLLKHTYKLARGFYSLGLRKGDRVAIYSENCFEWVLSVYALQFLGAIPVGIYATANIEDVSFMLYDCNPKIVLYGKSTKDSFFKTSFYTDRQPQALNLNIFDKNFKENIYSLFNDEEFLDEQIFDFSKISMEDVAQIVYTSGSSGNYKGAMLSHRAVNFAAFHALEYGGGDWGKERLLMFMPLSHIAESLLSIYLPAFNGFEISINDNILNIQKNLKETEPSIFLAVPILWDKFKDKIESKISKMPSKKKAFVSGLINTTLFFENSLYKFRSSNIFLYLIILIVFILYRSSLGRIVQKVVFDKIIEELGLLKHKMVFSAGAALSKDTALFFKAMGIKIVEVYGASETTATCFYNTDRHFKVGYLGRDISKGYTRISEEGELEIKAPFVFNGYYNNQEATKAAFTDDGYFKTGDLVEKNILGFYKIVGRKKDVIVLGSGENVSPLRIEGLLKRISGSSFSMVHGDEKKALEALFLFTDEDIQNLKVLLNIEISGRDDILNSSKVLSHFGNEISKINKELGALERIQEFKLLKIMPSIENGLLTPTLKLKRHAVIKKLKEFI